ncbi:MAG TPA: hypothetical protein VLT33_40590 [Labilithrix sp.]|nr:hypothetical protein [Labilithrix sp.]
MRTRSFGVLGASIAMASGLWIACGGSDGSDALVPAPTEAGTSTDPTKDASAANDAAPATDAGDGAALPQEAGGGDGGINPPDAGPGGNTSVLACGSTSCAIPAETCCVSQVGGGGTAYGCAVSCMAGGGGGGDTALKCSGQANCAAGTVCCVRQVNNGAASECKASCTNKEAQLCSLTAAVSGCVGSMCSSQNIGDWGLPTTYATCGGQGN